MTKSNPSSRSQLLAAGLTTLLLALIAGFFYAYACSVMVGLAQTDDVTFIAAMQAINANVRNVGFGISFFGALPVAAIAVALGIRRWRSPATLLLTAAFLTYAIGGFLLTVTISVPLNDQLAAAGDPHAITDPAAVRGWYEGPWVAWNLVRTIASTIALAFAGTALYRLGRDHAKAAL